MMRFWAMAAMDASLISVMERNIGVFMVKGNDDYVCIRIEGLALRLRIGLLDRERNAPQRVLIDMDLYVSPDYLQGVDARSILDYGIVCDQILALQAREHVDLLETLVQDLLALAFSYETVTAARVRVKKPDIVEQAQSVGIEVFRSRGEV